TDAHVLRLEEHLVAPGAALAPGARSLGAAEGLAQVAHVLTVDEAHAGLDGRGDAVGATEIVAPHVAAEPVGDVIGLGGGVRPVHMNVMVYGWASMAGIGTAIWLMARLCRTVLRYPLLLVAGAGFWNLGVFLGVCGILLGDSTGYQ